VKIQNVFKVVSNEKICPRFYRLCLDACLPARQAKPILKFIKPGQFIHIKVSDGLEPFFRRPFSVYRAQKYVEILYEPIGMGTKIMATKKPGDMLDVLGPLGNWFSLPPKKTKQIVMIAGGIGVAPFLIFSDVLKRKERFQTVSYEMILLYGGRSGGHVFPMKEFKKNGCKVYVATDDGSVGLKGRVSQLYDKIKTDPQTTAVYTCGPSPMIASVQEFTKKHNLWCQASCEEVMACALGACLGCSIETISGYKTVCYDGPVFDIREVIFKKY